MLLDKQEQELQRIAKLEERFEIQSDNLQLDKFRILDMLKGYHYQGPFFTPRGVQTIASQSSTNLNLPMWCY